MDSSDLYTTRDGDLEFKADEKPIDFSIPTTEAGKEEKSELETKELQSETIPIDLTMDGGTETGTIEEIETPETEQLITGRSVGEEIDNSPIELGEDIIISERENKIDFQQYALKNLKDAEDEQDAVTLKQLSEYEPEIADGSITTAKLADGSITTAKLADDAVTNNKIAENAITTSEIADESVTSNKIVWSTMATNSYSANGRFTADQTGNKVDLLSTNYTSKTGRVVIIATAPVKTSRYTSYLYVSVGDSLKSGTVTNEQSGISYLTSIWTGEIGTSEVTIKSSGVGQDSGTNVTIPQYKGYTLLIFDI